MHPFAILWKQKTLRFSDVFRGLRKGILGTNGLTKCPIRRRFTFLKLALVGSLCFLIDPSSTEIVWCTLEVSSQTKPSFPWMTWLHLKFSKRGSLLKCTFLSDYIFSLITLVGLKNQSLLRVLKHTVGRGFLWRPPPPPILLAPYSLSIKTGVISSTLICRQF